VLIYKIVIIVIIILLHFFQAAPGLILLTFDFGISVFWCLKRFYYNVK